jgi:hypothetical protein
MAHFPVLCPSVLQWAVPFQRQACLVFPLTTITFPVGYPLVVTRLMKAAIRMRRTNERVQNAAAVRPHQGPAPAPVHAAHAATQTREAIPRRPPQPGTGVATLYCYTSACPRSSLGSPRRSQPSDGPRTVTDHCIACATTYITSLYAC